MKKRISLLFVLILLISVSFIGCQKDIQQLDYVNILVNSQEEVYDGNTHSGAVLFTVNNNSNKYIVVSYFDDVYGEKYLTVDEAPYTIIEPQTTNPDFGYGYEYHNENEHKEILTKINKDYHFRVYLCDKDYLNKDEPIHKDIYRDITVHLQE